MLKSLLSSSFFFPFLVCLVDCFCVQLFWAVFLVSALELDLGLCCVDVCLVLSRFVQF